jgi:TP901 family phage tail tape measure protein
MAIVVNIVSKFYDRELRRAGNELALFAKKASLSQKSLSGSLIRSGAALKSAGDRASQTGKSMTTGLTLPLAGLGVLAWKAGSEYDSAMRQVQAATGGTAEEMAALSAQAEKMGYSSMYAAQDAAAAMLELAKSGLTAAQTKAGALQATMLLAAAGELELGSAAESVANTLNMFGLRARDAGQVANALAGGANASSASVDSLRQALAQVGPGARNAGLDLQTTTAILAAFANKGIQGSDAGTSLKTMLQRLIPMTDKAREAMRAYGLDFTDAQGRVLPMTQIAGQLQEKLGGLSMEQRNAALATIFGSDATRAATVLMQEGEKGIRRYIGATSDRRAASKMAAAQERSDSGQTKKAIAALKTAATDVQSAMAPMVRSVARWIGSVAKSFGELPDSTQKMVLALAGTAAVVGPLIFLLGKLTSGVGALMMTAGTFGSTFSGATAAGAKGLKAFGMAMNASGLAAMGWTLVIVAIIAALVLLYVKCEWFRKAVNKVFGFVAKIIKGFAKTAAAIFRWIGDHWRGLIDAFLLASGPIGWIVMYVIHHFDTVKKKVGGVLTWLWDKWKWLWKNVLQYTPVGAIVKAFVWLVSKVRGNWNEILRTIGSIVNKIGGFINTAFGWTGIRVPKVSWGSSSGGGSRATQEGGARSGQHLGDPSGGWDALLGGRTRILAGERVSVMPGDEPFTGDVGDVLSGIGSGIAGAADWMWTKAGSTISGILAHFPKVPNLPGPLVRLVPALLHKIAAKLKEKMKGLLGGLLGGGAANAGGPGYGWAYALARKFGLTVTSTHRPGAITAAGYPSDHGIYGRAADIAGPAGLMGRLWQYIKSTAGSWKQAIYGHQILNYGKLGYYAPSDHFDHVHVARNYSPGRPNTARGDDSRGPRAATYYFDLRGSVFGDTRAGVVRVFEMAERGKVIVATRKGALSAR